MRRMTTVVTMALAGTTNLQAFHSSSSSWLFRHLHLLRPSTECRIALLASFPSLFAARASNLTPASILPSSFGTSAHSKLDVALPCAVAAIAPAADATLEDSLLDEGDDVALPSSVYVHIPFCRRRCFYCDFPIVAVGERTEGKSVHMDAGMASYVDLVCREIRAAARASRSKPLETVFFGGGTPSLLPPPLLLRIVDALREHFGIAPGAEISMEMDPGTFDAHSLQQLLDGGGLTRVSMGVQSFQAELLKSCGRAHGLDDVYAAIDTIRGSGLRNWSLDLISSLPHQTLAQWEHSLSEAVAASPAHISVYDLQIEEGTLFHKWYKAGQSPLPSDDKAAEFYRTASARLRNAGFVHYEISNYAKEGFQCRHNLVYWHNRPYFAFGLGATSYVGIRRFSRPRKFKEYGEFVERFESAHGRVECPQDSNEERALDTVMLSLRLARGLDLRTFVKDFGASVAAVVCRALLPFASSGHVEFADADSRPVPVELLASLLQADAALTCEKPTHNPTVTGLAYVRLTDPAGFLFSNEVIASIFSALPGGGLGYHVKPLLHTAMGPATLRAVSKDSFVAFGDAPTTSRVSEPLAIR